MLRSRLRARNISEVKENKVDGDVGDKIDVDIGTEIGIAEVGTPRSDATSQPFLPQSSSSNPFL